MYSSEERFQAALVVRFLFSKTFNKRPADLRRTVNLFLNAKFDDEEQYEDLFEGSGLRDICIAPGLASFVDGSQEWCLWFLRRPTSDLAISCYSLWEWANLLKMLPPSIQSLVYQTCKHLDCEITHDYFPITTNSFSLLFESFNPSFLSKETATG